MMLNKLIAGVRTRGDHDWDMQASHWLHHGCVGYRIVAPSAVASVLYLNVSDCSSETENDHCCEKTLPLYQNYAIIKILAWDVNVYGRAGILWENSAFVLSVVFCSVFRILWTACAVVFLSWDCTIAATSEIRCGCYLPWRILGKMKMEPFILGTGAHTYDLLIFFFFLKIFIPSL
jgi:hypothetical protein